MDRVNCRESISTTLTELEVPKDRELQCLMQRADSLEKTLMLEKIEGRRRRG